jgi:hypothetical protein
MTEKEKTDITELIRKILDAPLPPLVSDQMYHAFDYWPTYGTEEGKSEAAWVRETFDHMVEVASRRDLVKPWLQ